MSKKANHILPRFTESAITLSTQLEKDIIALEFLEEGEEKHKTQKIMVETLHKLVVIMERIKNMEKSLEQDKTDDNESDQQIIDAFIEKIKSKQY